MKNPIKKISWLVLSAIIIITIIGYFCPMSIREDSMSSGYLPSLCQSVSSVNSGMGSATGCLDMHLVAMGQFLGQVPNMISLFLVLVLLTIVYRLFLRNFLAVMIQPLLSRLRHRYFCYQTSIKILIEKRLLKYLCFLGNYSVVSFS